jgi:hypothetical protein
LNVTVDQAFKGIRKIIGENVLEALKAASQEKVSPTRLATQKAIETVRRWKAEGAPTEEEYGKKLKTAAGAL